MKNKSHWRGITILHVEDDVPMTTSGDGMTERKRVVPLPDLPNDATGFDFLVAQIELWATEVLQQSGLQPVNSLDELSTADIPESYAQRFLYFIESTRERIASGDSVGAAAHAFILGEFKREAHLKFDWEEYALGGLDTQLGRGKGGRKTAEILKKAAAQRDEEIKRTAKGILKVNPHLSYSDLASILAERGHGGASAIIKKLPKLLG